MKTFGKFFNRLVATFIMLATFQFAHAQDDAKTVTTTHTETHYWYTEPWVWFVVGGVVLIVILIAALGGSNKTTIVEKTTHTVE